MDVTVYVVHAHVSTRDRGTPVEDPLRDRNESDKSRLRGRLRWTETVY